MKIAKLNKKKIIKYSLIAGGCIVLAYVSYKIGYNKSEYDVVKMVRDNYNNCGLIVDFKPFFTNEKTPVYMHYEA